MDKWFGVTALEREWTLFCGDSFDVLTQIQSESVDCVITSPPYYSLRDYKAEGQIGLEETVAEYINALCKVFNEVYRILKIDGLFFLNIGDTYYSGKGKSHGVDPKSHKRRFGLRPVDKSGGLGLKLQRKSIIGIPWRVAIEMMSSKWILRTPIIWHRSCLVSRIRTKPKARETISRMDHTVSCPFPSLFSHFLYRIHLNHEDTKQLLGQKHCRKR